MNKESIIFIGIIIVIIVVLFLVFYKVENNKDSLVLQWDNSLDEKIEKTEELLCQ